AVRLGCFVTEKEIFDEIGGLDEEISDDLVDLDYGLCLRGKGYRSVVLSQYHFSQRDLYFAETSDVLTSQSSDPERKRFFNKWSSKLPAQDPFYSPNLRFIGKSAKFQLDVDLPE
ncbi:MAG: hypothetical protein L7T80_08940, partial [Arenicellales bacterium]|nr:hypothetical protein [Arenicellales bacterium]